MEHRSQTIISERKVIMIRGNEMNSRVKVIGCFLGYLVIYVSLIASSFFSEKNCVVFSLINAFYVTVSFLFTYFCCDRIRQRPLFMLLYFLGLLVSTIVVGMGFTQLFTVCT